MKMYKNSDEILSEFKIDCSKCSGLCCVALFFSKIDGFPEDKVAGKPCIKLKDNFQCKIHSELGKKNMKGCIGYDCFGAGQHVTEVIYKGENWSTLKEDSKEMFDVFRSVFQLYQIRYFLKEAMLIIPAKELWKEIQELINENETICKDTPQRIINFDVEGYRNKVNVVLKQVSALVSKCFKANGNSKPINYLGKSFKKRNMSGVDLSMQLLIAANFDSCTFNGTIFLGADTRDTNFSNADLREAVFLTQGQINAAKGNQATKLPKHLEYPITWK